MNLRSHAVQEVAELLHIGFARGVVDDGASLGEYCRHDDVGRARHRRFVQEHIGAAQTVGFYLIGMAFSVIVKVGTQLLYTDKVRVQSAPSYLVASGFGDDSFSEAGNQRADQHYRAAQAGTCLQEGVALQIAQVHVCGLETIGVGAFLRHLHPHVAQQLDEVVHVQDVGHITHHHLVRCKQRGADDLQGLILSCPPSMMNDAIGRQNFPLFLLRLLLLRLLLLRLLLG